MRQDGAGVGKVRESLALEQPAFGSATCDRLPADDLSTVIDCAGDRTDTGTEYRAKLAGRVGCECVVDTLATLVVSDEIVPIDAENSRCVAAMRAGVVRPDALPLGHPIDPAASSLVPSRCCTVVVQRRELAVDGSRKVPDFITLARMEFVGPQAAGIADDLDPIIDSEELVIRGAFRPVKSRAARCCPLSDERRGGVRGHRFAAGRQYRSKPSA